MTTHARPFSPLPSRAAAKRTRLTQVWAQQQHEAILRSLKAIERGLARADIAAAKPNPIGSVEELRRLSFIEATGMVTRLGRLLSYYEDRLADVRTPDLAPAQEQAARCSR